MENVRHNSEACRFELEREGRLSVVDYHLAGGSMVITHTFVPPELRGQGIAEKLVRAALDHARAGQLKVVPQCSYVDTFLRRHPEDADLL
jgi:predicted GNAT family acetyltransferase